MKQLVVIVAMVFAAAGQALAQGQLEIITLRHRTAEQVLPVLQPLVERGGAISGLNNRIILRASGANRAEIKQALAAIDAPLRRLLITVKQDNERSSAASGAELSGSVGSGGARVIAPGSRDQRGIVVEGRRGDDVVRGRAYGTRGAASDRVLQQVQVIEGGRALIQVGYSFPIALREVASGPYGSVATESVVYRDIGTGFYAQPSLAGDTVTLEISPQQESLSRTDPGAVSSHRLTTTVSGRLGEWIELGGLDQDARSDRAGITSYSTRSGLAQRRVLLKVEEVASAIKRAHAAIVKEPHKPFPPQLAPRRAAQGLPSAVPAP